MSEWKLKSTGGTDSTINAIMGASEYTFVNKETSEERKVEAYSLRQAGELIAEGSFKKTESSSSCTQKKNP
jgi:hypothetical protein